MKRPLLIVVLFYAFTSTAFTQNVVTLDVALKEAMAYFVGQIPKGSRAAVDNFTAPNELMREYIVNAIIKGLVDGKVPMVERESQYLQAARSEISFGMSDEAGDEDAASAGGFLGAWVVISGSIEPMGGNYYLQLRALEVASGINRGIFTKALQFKGFNQNGVTLDRSIKEASTYFVRMLPGNTKAAFIKFTAPSEQIGNYIINELSRLLVDSRHLTLAERQEQNLAPARKEIELGMTDEFDDAEAVQAARFAGAGVVFTGSIRQIGNNWYLQVRAIETISAVTSGLFFQTVKSEDMENLFVDKAQERKAERERKAAERREAARETGRAILGGAKIVSSFLPHFVSAGTSFTTPLLNLSAYNHKFFAKSKDNVVGGFFDYGCDFGLFHAMDEIGDVTYYSFYPNGHINFGGSDLEQNGNFPGPAYMIHFGVGIGYMFSTYRFPNDTVNFESLALDFCFGLQVSFGHLRYNLRTNFKGINHTLALGFYLPY